MVRLFSRGALVYPEHGRCAPTRRWKAPVGSSDLLVVTLLRVVLHRPFQRDYPVAVWDLASRTKRSVSGRFWSAKATTHQAQLIPEQPQQDAHRFCSTA